MCGGGGAACSLPQPRSQWLHSPLAGRQRTPINHSLMQPAAAQPAARRFGTHLAPRPPPAPDTAVRRTARPSCWPTGLGHACWAAACLWRAPARPNGGRVLGHCAWRVRAGAGASRAPPQCGAAPQLLLGGRIAAGGQLGARQMRSRVAPQRSACRVQPHPPLSTVRQQLPRLLASAALPRALCGGSCALHACSQRYCLGLLSPLRYCWCRRRAAQSQREPRGGVQQVYRCCTCRLWGSAVAHAKGEPDYKRLCTLDRCSTPQRGRTARPAPAPVPSTAARHAGTRRRARIAS